MTITKTAAEMEPGDKIAIGRLIRGTVVPKPEHHEEPELREGIVCFYVEHTHSIHGRVITPFELAGKAEAGQLPDGAWWF